MYVCLSAQYKVLISCVNNNCLFHLLLHGRGACCYEIKHQLIMFNATDLLKCNNKSLISGPSKLV